MKNNLNTEVINPSVQTHQTPRSTDNGEAVSKTREWWNRWIAEKPFPERWTFQWWWEMAIIFTVFGIRGPRFSS